MTEVTRPCPRTAPCAVICRGDGSAVGAIIDPDKWPHEGGVAGFGDNLPDALRSLADSLEAEVGINNPFNLAMLEMLHNEISPAHRERRQITEDESFRIFAILEAR
jgi:hypothetical protein